MPFVPDDTSTKPTSGFVPDRNNIFPKEEPAKIKESFFKKLGDFGVGLAKGVGSTGSMGAKILGKITDPITKTDSQNIDYKPLTTPTNNAQKAGFITEQIGEFFIPGAAATKVGKVAKVLPKVSKLGATVLKEAASTGGVTLAQTGDIKTAVANAGISSAIPLVGRAKDILTRPVKKVLSERISPALLNKYVLKPGANAFQFGKDPGLGVAKEGLKANTREGLLTEIKLKKDEIGKQIDKVLTGAQGKKISLTPALKELDNQIMKASENGEELLYKRLTGIRDGLTSKFKIIEGKAVKVGDKPTEVSPYQAALIKREIGSAAKWTGQAFDNEANQARVKVYRIINDLIENAAPGSRPLNARYANMLTAEKALDHTIDVVKKQYPIGLINSGVGVATGTSALISGDSGPEAIAKGLATSLGLKGIQSTAIQTRLASSLSKLSNEERSALSKVVPILRNIIFGVNSSDQQNDQ